MEIGERCLEEENAKAIAQPQHVAFLDHLAVDGPIPQFETNEIGKNKQSEAGYDRLAMTALGKSIVSCHGVPSVMSEPPLKRSKLDQFSTTDKNLSSNNTQQSFCTETKNSEILVSDPEKRASASSLHEGNLNSYTRKADSNETSHLPASASATKQANDLNRTKPKVHQQVQCFDSTLIAVTKVSDPVVAVQYNTGCVPSASVPSTLNATGTGLLAISESPAEPIPRSAVTESGEPSGTLLSTPSSVEPGINDAGVTASDENQKVVPVKSATYHHLHLKYQSELEYMLREFQKLERQLLGAKPQNTVESSGSKERRVKLHSFILHLEETIQQIFTGCQLETEAKSVMSADHAANLSLSKDHDTEKSEEETVQKLEEHILVNLLPVKVRLKRQLAAQQGAKHNPAGMPTVRGGMQPSSSGNQQAKATFLRTAPPPERQPSQFGKPLDGGGSSLTQKLHGHTLGSSGRIHGHGVGQAIPPATEAVEGKDTAAAKSGSRKEDAVNEKPKILYAGMAVGSTQIHSSVSAATAVHNLVIQGSSILESAVQNKLVRSTVVNLSQGQTPITADNASCGWSSASSVGHALNPVRQLDTCVKPTEYQEVESKVPASVSVKNEQVVSVPMSQSLLTSQQPQHAEQKAVAICEQQQNDQINEQSENISEPCGLTSAARDAILNYEERRRLLKKRRKRKKKQFEQQHSSAVQGSNQPSEAQVSKRGKKTQSQRGPRNVEYLCALCNEIYSSTCDYNPWWALTQHDCPKCHKMQIPRIDISAPANAIEYHPALLAHADENTGGTPSAVMFLPPKVALSATSSDSESDLSDDDGILSDGEDSLDFSDSEPEDAASMTIADKAENEKFGMEYEGPKLSDNHASRLLILMLHASTCPGFHRSKDHDDVCRSTKWMMLHVRDCPGTTATSDVCPFPWCRKVKHLLYHLVSCEHPQNCLICSPVSLSSNMKKLSTLNEHRFQARRTLGPFPSKPGNIEFKDSGDAPEGKNLSRVKSNQAATDLTQDQNSSEEFVTVPQSTQTNEGMCTKVLTVENNEFNLQNSKQFTKCSDGLHTDTSSSLTNPVFQGTAASLLQYNQSKETRSSVKLEEIEGIEAPIFNQKASALKPSASNVAATSSLVPEPTTTVLFTTKPQSLQLQPRISEPSVFEGSLLQNASVKNELFVEAPEHVSEIPPNVDITSTIVSSTTFSALPHSGHTETSTYRLQVKVEENTEISNATVPSLFAPTKQTMLSTTRPTDSNMLFSASKVSTTLSPTQGDTLLKTINSVVTELNDKTDMATDAATPLQSATPLSFATNTTTVLSMCTGNVQSKKDDLESEASWNALESGTNHQWHQFSPAESTILTKSCSISLKREGTTDILPLLSENSNETTLPLSLNLKGVVSHSTECTVSEKGLQSEGASGLPTDFIVANTDEKKSLLECTSKTSGLRNDQVSTDSLVKPLQVQ